MSSHQQPQPRAKRRRVAEETLVPAHQQTMERQSMSNEQLATHLANTARSYTEAQHRAAAELQAQRSIQLSAMHMAQVRAGQMQAHITGGPLDGQNIRIGKPTQAQYEQQQRTQPKQSTAQRAHRAPPAATTAVRTSTRVQQTEAKRRQEKELAAKAAAANTSHGRTFSRLPGQIYPVAGKAQPGASSHNDANKMAQMQRHQQAGMDYNGAMNNMRGMITQAPMPVNPDVKLKRLPFYDILGELMKPSTLMPKSSSRMQETLFVFHLTPQQAQDITMSRDFRPGAKSEYTVQIQVRFCLLETTCEQADTFPSQIQVRVNNKPAQLPPKPLPLHNKAAPKHYGNPVDITPFCRLSPTHSNAITVSWCMETAGVNFCMSIYLVKKLSSDILLKRLHQFGNRHADHTRALIKEKLTQDADSEIATTSLRVSLMCPLGKMRMTIPCRSSICPHLQCFDAHTFLMMNERKPTWNCPVCDRPCPYDKLIIDGYFVEILKKEAVCNDINFHEDGSWSPMKKEKESSKQVNLSSNDKNNSSSSSARSGSPVSVTATTAQSAQETAASTTSTSAATNPSKGPVIDLTLDSSDEEDDAVIPNDPVSSPPVISLDSPSPAPMSTMPASPPVVLSSSSSPQSSAGASHSSSSAFPTNIAASGPQSSPHPVRESPTPNESGSPVTRNSTRTQSPTTQLQNQALNLEAMSDADFDEFLKGLSWGV